MLISENTLPFAFDLKGQDEFSDSLAISVAMDVAKHFIQHLKVTARQIVGLRHAL